MQGKYDQYFPQPEMIKTQWTRCTKIVFSWLDIIIYLPVESVHTCTILPLFGKSLRLQTLKTFSVKWAEYTETWTASTVNPYAFVI